MNSTPLFSVITISFNQAVYLKECINSLKIQDSRMFEHIIVDPGSTDASRDIIDAYTASSDNVFPIYGKDLGPADGLNNGWQIARGKYILIINADDYLLPGAIRACQSLVSRSDCPDLILCGGLIYRQEQQEFFPWFSTKPSHAVLAFEIFLLFQQGIIVRKSSVATSTPFNLANRTCWDAEFVHSLLSSKSINVERSFQQIAVFRLHESSITGSSLNTKAYVKDRIRIMRQQSGHFGGTCKPLMFRLYLYLPLIQKIFIAIFDFRFAKKRLGL
jgi:glycosyltransferase involved in cell wall biosynthesis